MRKFLAASLMLFSSLALAAPDAEMQKKFAGTWEAKYKHKVICTIRVKADDQISGETQACTINVDGNGDLQEPDTSQPAGEASPMLNPRVHGDTLSFEHNEDGEVVKFEMKLVGDGQAELTILDAPVPVKPIHFTKISKR